MSARFMLLVLAASAAFGSFRVGAAETDQKVARVGFIAPLSASTLPRVEGAFWKRLNELGWVEGKNLVIWKRSAEGQLDRLPALMAEAVALKVDVLVTYGTPAAVAATKSTNTIPIVVAVTPDAVRSGLANSLARPGGNFTGLSEGHDANLSGKMLE